MNKPAETPVSITVTGGGDEEDSIVLRTRGILEDVPEGWALKYDEVDPDGMDVIHTRILCEKDRVSAQRTGSLMATMVFVPGEVFACDYQTAVGTLSMQLFPLVVEARRRGKTGRVKLRYQITSGSMQSVRFLEASFSPCKH